MDIEKEILEKINLKHEASDGKNGYYISTLRSELNIEYSKIKPILSKIYNEKKITIRNGVNGKMIFKK